MIAHLTGKVIQWQESYLVVDVNGVGYAVFAPFSTTCNAQQGEAVALYIHTVVREDALQLYGFLTPAERDMFLLLTGVSGVGPKVALAVLSTLSIADLSAAIARQDVTLLSKTPGVGKKTASRLALELKEKVTGFAVATPIGAAVQMMQGAAGVASPAGEAISALVNLGYPKSHAERAIHAAASGTDDTVEVLIRKALAALS